MTCIIGYIDRKNKKTYLGADSCVSNGYTHDTLPNSFKIFKSKDNPNILIGFSGTLRNAQILKYNIKLPSEEELEYNKEIFNEEYIITKVIPNIQFSFKNNDLQNEGKTSKVWLILAYKDKLFYVESNYGVREIIDDYASVGSGEYHASGSLFTSKSMDIDITEKIHIALQASSKYCDGVSKPFYIINTEDDEIKEFLD